ncbi:MAG: class I adenylate-forming enzyme family protein [Dorea sp.]|uniref:class I adenylate-forming enzyme family protein n=1 Tax=Dorea sp. TaxID=2040332 RepID=UPI00399542BA
MYKGEDLWKKPEIQVVKKTLSNGKVITTYPDLPKNIYSSFRATAERHMEKVAVVDDEGRQYSYKKMMEMTDDFSSWLIHEFGVTRRKHVALMLYNSIEFCTTFLSLNRIGAVVVPLPTKFKMEEVHALVEKLDVEFIICDEKFEDYFEKYQQNLNICVVPDGKEKYGLETFTSTKDLSAIEEIEEKATDVDLALMLFTSGTTSMSKGVTIRNYNIMHAVESYHKVLGITEEDKAIIPVPIYLVTGLVAVFGLMIHIGGTVCLNRFFDAKRVLEDINKYGITFFHASPTVFTLILKERKHYPELPMLRMFACGSCNMPPEKIKMLHEWLPKSEFRTIYGLTETTSPGTVFPTDASSSPYIGSSGIPIPGSAYKIVDEEGNEVKDGEQGEILVKGSNITENYYKSKRVALEDEWLHTGDIGWFNTEGYLYIADRKKDMINRGGEKICSYDVENKLLEMNGVEDAAVVGIPDELYGEVPAALIKLKKGTVIEEAEIKAFLKSQMASYKVPQKILFTENIPLTENMKINKRKVRKMFSEQLEGELNI